MNIHKSGYVVVLAILLSGIAFADEADREAINDVLDGFHDAAAHGDKDRFLGLMTDDAVFMGTDEWERWPKKPEFSDYVASRFKDGSGWNYKPVERQLNIADSADFAWFDEVVYSEANGRFRGTGVLVKVGNNWKIAHYAMSFLVYNENWQDVIELTRATRELKQESQQ